MVPGLIGYVLWLEFNLLVLDDWMRDPITLQNAQDILEVLDDRFGHTSTLIASQVPIAEWHRQSQILLLRMPFWIASFTMLIALN